MQSASGLLKHGTVSRCLVSELCSARDGVRAGAGLTSNVSAKRQHSSEVAGVPILDEVHPIWLEASPGERCALSRDAGSALLYEH